MKIKHEKDEVIRAWLDGKTVQYLVIGDVWEDLSLDDAVNVPAFSKFKWRIKPKKETIMLHGVEVTEDSKVWFNGRDKEFDSNWSINEWNIVALSDLDSMGCAYFEAIKDCAGTHKFFSINQPFKEVEVWQPKMRREDGSWFYGMPSQGSKEQCHEMHKHHANYLESVCVFSGRVEL